MYRHSFVALFAVVATATTSVGAVSAAPVSAHGSETLVPTGARETAAACIELGEVTECFDSEAELLAAHPDVLGGEPGRGGEGDRNGGAASRAAASSCSSSVRLYNSSSFGGAVLFLTTRGTIHNLADYGFDNSTSSYRVGGCPAVFFSLANFGGAAYPGYTGSYAQYPSMIAGWNNVVSSVYIY